MNSGEVILAIDPGREKCGLAIILKDEVLLQEIVARNNLVKRLATVLPPTGPIVVGDRTGSKDFITELSIHLPEVVGRVVLVDEHLSSVEARKEYWRHNSPTGIKRFIPVSLQVPPEPFDDFVAVILARRHQFQVNNGLLEKS